MQCRVLATAFESKRKTRIIFTFFAKNADNESYGNRIVKNAMRYEYVFGDKMINQRHCGRKTNHLWFQKAFISHQGLVLFLQCPGMNIIIMMNFYEYYVKVNNKFQ